MAFSSCGSRLYALSRHRGDTRSGYFGEPKACIFAGNPGETTRDLVIFQKSSCTFTFWGYTLSEPYWRFPNLYPKPLVLPLIISDNLDDSWALNARATSKKLTVFSMKTGQLLPGAGGEKELKTPANNLRPTFFHPFFFFFHFFYPRNHVFPCFSHFFQHFFGGFGPGCEIQLPLRFDKVCVYPGHKVGHHPVGFLGDGDDISMIFLWYFYDISMGSLKNFSDISMIFGFWMIFLWYF